MLFIPHYHRPRSPRLLTDGAAKAILARGDLRWVDRGQLVSGRIIGWKRTDSGALGAIVAYPVTGARHLWGVNFKTGGVKHLKRLI